MPTRAEREHSSLDPLHITLQGPCHSWTDDLPVCPLSGVGESTNQVYRLDGIRREEHEFEDRSFHFRQDDETFFYGVFDGQFGSKAVDFAHQRMPAEILLGQLRDKKTDTEFKDVLQQAFLTVETTFFQSIDNLLAEKENLRLQLQGLRTYEAVRQYPEVVQRLNSVTVEIESETTAVVALIRKNKLYVANVGNSRALLFKEDKLGNTRIHQLSVDHDFHNEDELLRLSQLGLDVKQLRQGNKTRRHQNTRCIGNYTIKGGYIEFDNLSEATDEPIIAEPNIFGGIEVDETCKFLLLMSDGLYKSLEQATGTEDANNVIVQMVMEQFAEQFTLNGVAQAVVDKVVRIHHDVFMRNTEFSECCRKRDDITLLVRNFSYPLPNAHRSSPNLSSKASGLFQQAQEQLSPNKGLSFEPGKYSNLNTLSDIPSIENSISLSESTGDIPLDNNNTKEESVSSSSESGAQQTLFKSTNNVSLDEEGKIKSYVDFSDFYASVEEAYQKGLVPEDWCDPCPK